MPFSLLAAAAAVLAPTLLHLLPYFPSTPSPLPPFLRAPPPNFFTSSLSYTLDRLFAAAAAAASLLLLLILPLPLLSFLILLLFVPLLLLFLFFLLLLLFPCISHRILYRSRKPFFFFFFFKEKLYSQSFSVSSFVNKLRSSSTLFYHNHHQSPPAPRLPPLPSSQSHTRALPFFLSVYISLLV